MWIRSNKDTKRVLIDGARGWPSVLYVAYDLFEDCGEGEDCETCQSVGHDIITDPVSHVAYSALGRLASHVDWEVLVHRGGTVGWEPVAQSG
jgi:hypothetical protein